MQLLDRDVPPLGMGCWPIAGKMSGFGRALGYAGAGDDEALRTIRAALDGGIRVFDTAAAYGAGHSERLLGRALGDRDDVIVVTKIGFAIDEGRREITGPDPDPAAVLPAIDRARARLRRDRVDMVLLHLNGLPVAEALPVFDRLEEARQSGRIGGYGWSTDFSANVAALDPYPGVAGIEHAMNVFYDAPRLQATLAERRLPALIRSPLAMGLLTGKYGPQSVIPEGDVRASDQDWVAAFRGGRPNPAFLKMLDAVRELLQTGGRSLTQGAIGWLWAKSARNLPLPGARTAAQITETAGALALGPLPPEVMDEIERVIDRPAEGAERER